MRITELTKLKESYSDDYDMDNPWEDDYEGDLDKEEYDKTVKDSQMEYAVWVGGTEVNDQWVSYDEAVRLYDKYKAQGYDDVQLDARIKEDVEEAAKPDFLDLDKDGDKKEPMKKAAKDKKAIKEEEEEAVAARDEFMKVMDIKPKSSNKAIDTIKKIVADKQNMQVKFDDGKMKVDLYTASAVSQVYDAVNDSNKEKIDNMLRTKEGMLRMSNFAFTKLSEQVQVLENAEKEGRLDEVLPLVPLAIGAARVLGPMAAKALVKKFGKKAVKNAAGKFKQGMNPNSVATQIKKGAGDSVGKQILKKSPGWKAGLGVGVADKYGAGGSGSGMTLGGDIYNMALGGDNSSSSNSSSTRSNSSNSSISNYANKVAKGWESKKVDGKNISEYAGKDVVYDKNGKPHDPNSSKGKTIVNMKCNNPTVKDKTGCGTGTDKDKKRRNMALLKKGAGMAKDGVKKLGKAAASSVTATGFANPFESLEAKATKMIEDAVEKTEKMPKIDPTKIKTPTNMKVTSHGKTSTSKDKKMPGDHHPDLKLSAKVLF